MRNIWRLPDDLNRCDFVDDGRDGNTGDSESATGASDGSTTGTSDASDLSESNSESFHNGVPLIRVPIAPTPYTNYPVANHSTVHKH